MLDVKEIEKIIPHRHPFLLVDRIDEIEPGKKAVGCKCFTYDEWFFKGHFPEQPVVPGVLIIEALAQVGAVAMLSLDDNKGKIPFFGGISKARFKRKIVPGDSVVLECEIIKHKGSVGVGQGTAYVNGKVAVTAEITFAIN